MPNSDENSLRVPQRLLRRCDHERDWRMDFSDSMLSLREHDPRAVGAKISGEHLLQIRRMMMLAHFFRL